MAKAKTTPTKQVAKNKEADNATVQVAAAEPAAEQVAAEPAAENATAAEQVAEEPAASVEIEEQPATAENPLVAVGKKLLADNPTQAEIFMSADGFGFFQECDAKNYARSLENKTIITVKR